ncbi:MAG TPA: PAS domain S-box protein [Pyrinomonadaceae bacterium]|nr:PAS domain S-box protein [Pyrinomonadaceae bacterium]
MNSQSQPTILVVNDSPDQLDLAQFILRQAEYTVLTASSGNKGFEIVCRSVPDLVVSDVIMPDGDGIEFCRRLRADEKFQTLPILLVSGLRKDTASVIEGLESGADDYLELPFDPVHLVARVARLIERKRTEDVLRENESYFRSFIENVSDIISILSREGIVYYESPSIKQILGYEPDYLTGKNALDFIHPEDRASVIDYFNQSVRQKREPSAPIEYRFRSSDGLWRVLESVGSLIDDPNKGIVAVINSRDVTERLRAENILRQSEANLAAAQRITHLGSWEVELNDLRRVNNNKVRWSDEVYRIFGYQPGSVEVSINRYFKSIHPADRAGSRRAFFEAVTCRKDLNIEFRVALPTGDERILHGQAEVVFDDATGKPLKFIGTVQDITERKRIENELRESEERYRAFVAQSSEAIWRFEMNPPCPVDVSEDEQIAWFYRCGRLAECNDVMARMYGFGSAVEIVGARIGDMLPLDDPANVEYLYSFIRSGYKLDNSESHEIDRNGNPRIFSNSLTGFIENGFIKRVWGTQRDITERREAENAIRFQAHLLDTVEQAVIATDLRGVVVYWSKFAQKLYGWTAEEAIGAPVMNLTTPDASIEQGKTIMARLAAGESWSGEFNVKTKEDKTFPALVTNTPIYDEKGTLVGIVGVSKDITERKKAETALVEANERAIREYTNLLQRLAKLGETVGVARDLNAVFTAVLEFTRVSAPCSALIISLYEEKSKMRRVIYCWYNGGEMDTSKLEAVPVGEGIAGQSIKTGDVIIRNDYLQAIRERGVAVSFGFDEDARNPQSSIIAPMKIKGGSIGVIEVQSYEPGAYRDEHATAMSMAANFIANAIENVRLLELERQREEQLRQSQKLESVGRLAGGIAHDFNNMLTAINGYSSLTLRRLKADDPLRRNIEEIKKAGERSAALTHQLLAFSRRQVLLPKVLDINQTVNDINFMLKRLIGEDVQLVSALSSAIGRVEVDPGQLSQVIMNLAVNARDAMPTGGVLTIETGNVYLDEEFAARHVPTQSGHYVMLAVTDTGTGIAPETREHIFEPFFTTKEVGKGTGLGLATVYGIVKQSGGYIWVESELGLGTTFKIYLPRVDERAAPEVRQAAPEELAAGTETILLVEDEPMVRNLTRQVLEDCGYTVIEAGNGVEALEICNTTDCQIDLLMTDVVMPKMGGRELAEKLAVTLPQMKVLFTSGYTDDSTLRHGVIEVGTNFIQKPFSPTALALKVRNILDASK